MCSTLRRSLESALASSTGSNSTWDERRHPRKQGHRRRGSLREVTLCPADQAGSWRGLSLTEQKATRRGSTMTATVDRPMTTPPAGSTERLDPWRDFDGGRGARRRRRDFIRANYALRRRRDVPRRPDRAHDPPVGGAAAAVRRGARARHLRRRRRARRRTITAHAPGYIDRDHELIVGLQTDAPLQAGDHAERRPADGRGRPARPTATSSTRWSREIFTKYRKTHNDGVFDAYTAADPAPPARPASSPACPTPTAAAGSSATTAGSRCTASTG